MKRSERLNLALMRAAFVLVATFKWTWDDVVELGGDGLVNLIGLIGNVLGLALTIVVGPFQCFWKALGKRKYITKDTTWTKQRKSPTA